MVTRNAPESKEFLYVAKPQLFSLAMESSVQGSSIPVWANIFDAKMRAVYNMTTLSNEFRSGASLLLMPGTYYVQLGARFDSAASSPSQATIRLLGSADSEPIGPLLLDEATTPIYGCPDVPDKYCYPPDFETTEPFVLLPEPPFDLPSTFDFPLEPITGDGFFGTSFERFNIDMPLDSNNDGFVTSVDALLIINRLNQFGAGQAPARLWPSVACWTRTMMVTLRPLTPCWLLMNSISGRPAIGVVPMVEVVR